MQYNKKIEAYTLSEMIIVLILTSIVVGLAFSVLRMVQGQLFSIQQNFENTTEVRKLEQSLSLDMNRYTSIFYNPNREEITFKTPIDSIKYELHNEYVVKEQDTFLVKFNKKEFFRKGAEVKRGRVDAIKLQTIKEFQSRNLFLFQRETATDYMK